MKVYMLILMFLALTRAEKKHESMVDFKRSLNTFTAELYYKITSADKTLKNIFYSPTSIATTIGMVLTGSGGVTEDELRRVLIINPNRGYTTHNLNKLFRKTYNKLFNASRKHQNKAILANRMYYQEGYEILPAYIKNLTEFYQAQSEAVNFGEKSIAVNKINSWISEITEGLIDDLLSEDSLGDLTRLVLVNALYFKASWLKTMTKTNEITKFGYIRNFTAHYMTVTTRMLVSQKEDVTYVLLPYKGNKDTMFIVMPENKEAFDTFGQRTNLLSFLQNLDFNMHYPNLRPKKVKLTMPMFEFEQRTNMKKILINMKAKSLFDPALANLEKIADEHLYVTDFEHKAKIKVDEEGTEAAAASGVVIAGRSAGSNKIVDITIDKPFYFAIVRQGYILFFGRMVEPQLSESPLETK